MNGNYIVKNKEGIVLNFCFENNSIFLKEYSDRKWEKRERLIESVRSDFSVNISDDGDLYLICQNIRGDVILLNFKNNVWNKKIILKSKSERGNNILFYALIHKTEMELIYIIDYGNKKSEIMLQNTGQNGNASKAVDSALSLPEGYFKMQKIYNSHYVIFYQKRENEYQFGYKEINGESQSDYIVFHRTGYRIIDSSFITDKDGIYFLYIVKSMFSSQVIFRKKDDKGLSNPIVVYEGQGINLCNLFFADGILYAVWIINKQLFYSISKTQGNSFERFIRDKKYSGINWVKANYIEFNSMNKSDFLANEIFADVRKNFEPVFVTDFYNDFYTKKIENKQVVSENVSPIDLKNNKENNLKNESISITIERMKNQIEIAQKQSNEKDKQIIQLNNIIQSKNREIIRIENNFMKRINELRNEIKKLKAEKNKNDNSKNIINKDPVNKNIENKTPNIENTENKISENIKNKINDIEDDLEED